MIATDDLFRGVECLDQAVGLLNQGQLGALPSEPELERFRDLLHQAEGLIETARGLLGRA